MVKTKKAKNAYISKLLANFNETTCQINIVPSYGTACANIKVLKKTLRKNKDNNKECFLTSR